MTYRTPCIYSSQLILYVTFGLHSTLTAREHLLMSVESIENQENYVLEALGDSWEYWDLLWWVKTSHSFWGDGPLPFKSFSVWVWQFSVVSCHTSDVDSLKRLSTEIRGALVLIWTISNCLPDIWKCRWMLLKGLNADSLYYMHWCHCTHIYMSFYVQPFPLPRSLQLFSASLM